MMRAFWAGVAPGGGHWYRQSADSLGRNAHPGVSGDRAWSDRSRSAMSDSFEMLVDVDVGAEEAEGVARTVLDRFHTLGLISGEANRDCVLGGTGYRPGPAVADLYSREDRESLFWELVTCGVEVQVGRGFNEWALGPVCEGFRCSACDAAIEPFGDEFGDALGTAIGEWVNQSGPALVPCPRCCAQRSITAWECRPPLGFGNLSVRFWNWPPLDSSSWKIDIPRTLEDVTCHMIVKTHGHL